jgi:tRNA A-37 threonylcarbamoyl transferase component Bud32
MEDAVIARAHDLTGITLGGRYEVLGKLGVGGMASVYEGRRVGLHNRVAIKVLRPDLCEDPSNVKRFLREARASSVIEHDNIVDIVDFGPTESLPVYFVMEFLEGTDLREELKSNGRMEWPRARNILAQVVGALAAAHNKSIVHRDVKPANIFLIRRKNGEEVAKVLDFGIAKVIEETMGGLTRGQTMTNGLLGTVAYMAPEQARGDTIDARTDVYAVGVVAYQMLTGRAPFKGNNPYVVLEQHVSEPPRPPTELVPSIPPEAEALILRCLQKSPEQRFQSMHELGQVLAHGNTLEYAQGTGQPRAPTWNAPHPDALEAATAAPPQDATEALGSGSSHRAHGVATSYPAQASTPMVAPVVAGQGVSPHTVRTPARNTVATTSHTEEPRKSKAMLPALLALGVGLGLLLSLGIVLFVLEPREQPASDAPVPRGQVDASVSPTPEPEPQPEPQPVPQPEAEPDPVPVAQPEPKEQVEPEVTPEAADTTPTKPRRPRRPRRPKPAPKPQPEPTPAKPAPQPKPESKALHPDLQDPYG